MEIGNRTGKSRFHEFLQELSIWLLFFILKFISCYLSANTTSKQCGKAYSEIWGVLSQVSRNCWCCLDWHRWFTKMTRSGYFNAWSMSQTLSCNFRVQSPFFTDVSHSPNEKGLHWLNEVENEHFHTMCFETWSSAVEHNNIIHVSVESNPLVVPEGELMFG